MDRLITAAPALIFGAVMATSAAWAIAYSVRGGEHRTRQGTRRLQSYANHPGVRAVEQHRKEDR